MSDVKYLSLDDLLSEDDVRYTTVQTKRGPIKLGSACSADVLEWFQENADPVKSKFSGIRLTVKCFIQPDGTRIGDGLPEDEKKALRESKVLAFTRHDSMENGKIVRACLMLNGLRPTDDKDKGAAKNDSSETVSGSLPTASPLQSEKSTSTDSSAS